MACIVNTASLLSSANAHMERGGVAENLENDMPTSEPGHTCNNYPTLLQAGLYVTGLFISRPSSPLPFAYI